MRIRQATTRVTMLLLALVLAFGGLVGTLAPRVDAAATEAPATASLTPADALLYVDIQLDVLSTQWLQAFMLLQRMGQDASADSLISQAAGLDGENAGAGVASILGGRVALVVLSVDTGVAADSGGLGGLVDAVSGGVGSTDSAVDQAAEVLDTGGVATIIMPVDMAAAEAAIVAGAEGETLETMDYEGVEVTGYKGDPMTDTAGTWWAVLDDAIVTGNVPEDVTAIIDVAKGGAESMADRAEMAPLMELLPAEHIVFGALNAEAAAMAAEETLEESGAPVAIAVNDFTLFTVGTEPDGVRIEARTIGVDGPASIGMDEPFEPSLEQRMPEDTILYTDGASFATTAIVNLGLSLVGGLLASSMGGATSPDAGADPLASLSALLGIDLQAGFIDKLAGEYAFGLWGLETMDPTAIGAALLVTTDDPLAVGTTVGTLMALVTLGAQGAIAVTPTSIGGGVFSRLDLAGSGLPVTVDLGVADDLFVVGIGNGAEVSLEGSGGSLADNSRYVAAMANMPAERNGVFYVDIAALEPLLGMLSETGDAGLGTLQSLALVGWIDGDAAAVTGFISIPEA